MKWLSWLSFKPPPSLFLQSQKEIQALPDGKLKELASEISDVWFHAVLLKDIPIVVAKRILEREVIAPSEHSPPDKDPLADP